MSEKRFKLIKPLGTRLGLKDIFIKDTKEDYYYNTKEDVVDLLNKLSEENEQLKKELKRCKDWINSDKNDYELTLAFIKNKGYSLKDVLEYEKELFGDE